MPTLKTLFTVAVFLGAVPAIGARTTAAEPAEDAALVREYLTRMTAFGFSGAVLVRRGGETLVRDGFGLADREARTPVTIDTRFYVASLAKPLTAAAVLRLADAGRLTPADSIARFLPGVPRDRHAITVGHLLTHSAGVADVRRRASDAPLDRDAFVAAAFSLPARFAPGERTEYSNTGYALLAAIVEKASGRPFGDYLTEAVLGPLDMRATTLVTAVPAGAPLAKAYYRDAMQGDAAITHQQPHSWETFGATGITTTLRDLEKFDRMQTAGDVLSPAALTLMNAPQQGSWAYGWTVQDARRGARVLRHDGLLMPEGWNAEFRRYPDEDATIIVLANVHEAEPLGWRVAAGLDGLLHGGTVTMPPAVQPYRGSEFAAWTGEYAAESGARWSIEMSGGALGVRPLNQRAVNALVHSGKPADLFESENAQRQAIITALFSPASQTAEALAGLKDRERWTTRAATLREWLASRFGAFGTAEVLQTISDPASPDFTETFVRLRLDRQSTTVRTVWAGNDLVGLSDEGAFRGVAQEVPLYPGLMPLARQGGERFFAWPFSGTPVGVRLARDAGAMTITVARESARRVR